jgi:hypothetical protein
VESGEQCDGTADDACPGQCQVNCQCEGMPTASEWGVVALMLLLLAAMTIKFGFAFGRARSA